MTMFPSEIDKIWYELFKVALVGSAQLNPDKAAERAAQIATDAQMIVSARFAVKPNADAPLFTPYLEKQEAQRQQDEADSAFAVTK